MELQERNNTKIKTLHPLIRNCVWDLVFHVKKELNIDLIITYAFRSFEEQDLIYEKGRSLIGEIVSYAKSGESYHNYGLALDVKPNISHEEMVNFSFWKKIGDIGKKIGFEWGGDFSNIDDKRHFQKTFGLNYREMHGLVKGNEMTNGFIIINE